MATYKIDLLIRQQTNKGGGNPLTRVGGWSDGWYFQGTQKEAVDAAQGISLWRAKLLTTAAQVIGQRVRLVGGGSATSGGQFPGTIALPADIPQMSLLIAAGGLGVVNVRRFFLKGIADARVVEGEYSPTSEMEVALQDYADHLQDFGIRFKCQDFFAREGVVDTIDGNGVVVFGGIDPGFSDGDVVKGLFITNELTKRAVKGKWTIKIPVGGGYKLQSYVSGRAFGGRLRRIEWAYPIIDKNNFHVVRVGTHKIGKDFFQFHGRVSSRS